MYQAIREYFYRISDIGLLTVAIELFSIGVVVYLVLRFLQGTRGLRLIKGLVVILVAMFLLVKVAAFGLHLERINVLYGPIITLVLFGSVIVFQPELRRALMQLGETRWLRRWIGPTEQIIEPIIKSVTYLSKNKIGALVAIERQVGLGTVVDSGVRIDALITAELLNTIFWPSSALHDMGVVIQQGRIAAAGCTFPIRESDHFERSLGSRHRAALGLSEDSDSLVIVVSEENGAISLAVDGRLIRALTPQALRTELGRLLNAEPKQQAQQIKKTPPIEKNIGQ